MKFIYTIQQYDVSMFTWFLKRKHYVGFIRLSRLISRTGDGPLYVLLAGMIYWFDAEYRKLFLQAGLWAFAVERSCYFIIKNGLRRHRPAAALQNFKSHIIPADQFSFPSGHTSAAFLVAALVSYFYPLLAPLAFSWAVLVGLSRIFLGVHFPTDVLMGMALGIGSALFSLQIVLQ